MEVFLSLTLADSAERLECMQVERRWLNEFIEFYVRFTVSFLLMLLSKSWDNPGNWSVMQFGEQFVVSS